MFAQAQTVRQGHEVSRTTNIVARCAGAGNAVGGDARAVGGRSRWLDSQMGLCRFETCVGSGHSRSFYRLVLRGWSHSARYAAEIGSADTRVVRWLTSGQHVDVRLVPVEQCAGPFGKPPTEGNHDDPG